MSPGTPRQLWFIGDRVRFAHQHPDGPVHIVSAVWHTHGDPPMVELKDMAGHFASHLFIAADYPADSIVPRSSRPPGTVIG